MAKAVKKTVFFDTSFLITLLDSSRANHDNAKKYYKYFIENEIVMFISVIVVSEYSQKQPMDGIIATNNFITPVFNYADAIVSGEFSNILSVEDVQRTDSRNVAKDDIKLLAQCANNSIDYIATDDISTLAKYTHRLNDLGKLKTQVITMNAFDMSIFNGGQMTLDIKSE